MNIYILRFANDSNNIADINMKTKKQKLKSLFVVETKETKLK